MDDEASLSDIDLARVVDKSWREEEAGFSVFSNGLAARFGDTGSGSRAGSVRLVGGGAGCSIFNSSGFPSDSPIIFCMAARLKPACFGMLDSSGV